MERYIDLPLIINPSEDKTVGNIELVGIASWLRHRVPHQQTAGPEQLEDAGVVALFIAHSDGIGGEVYCSEDIQEIVDDLTGKTAIKLVGSTEPKIYPAVSIELIPAVSELY